ncbi:MAG: glycosyltransferase family 4 protein [Candidatus Eremiobacteraeota bacterium]|nr:glycosyltransferase family 4 protein [Candidatus Eremiobacteraeota bacterium]
MNTYEKRAESGGFVHLFQTAKRWRGVELTIFGPEAARSRVCSELPSAHFSAIPSCENLTGNRAVVYAFRALSAAAMLPKRLRRFDAIYVLSQSLPDILPAILARPGRTVAQVFHLQPPPWKRPGSLLNNIFAYVNESLGVTLVRRFARNVVVLTSSIEPALRLAPGTHVTAVGSGTWTIPIDAFGMGVHVRAGAIYVGRLHPAKGINDVIDAWAIVQANLPDAVLTLVGSGDEGYIRALHTRIERLSLADSVRFAGFVAEEEKARILGNARAFITASREEGWGIAVAEALALGVPSVTYDLPVFRDVFSRGRIGVPVGDVNALANGILTLLKDDETHARLSAQARELAANFSWDSVARAEEEAIRRAVEQA